MQLSQRCMMLRENAVNVKPFNDFILPQHPILFEEGIRLYLERGGKPGPCLIAAGMENVLCKAPALIQEGELLVGYNYADTPYPEFWSPQDTPEDRELVLNAGFTQEQFQNYLAHHDTVLRNWQFDRHAWNFNAGHDPAVAEQFPFLKTLTQQELELDDEWAAIGRCMSDNHTIIGYEKVLKYGFSGLLAQVEEAEQANGSLPLYDAAKTLCRSARVYAEHYSQKARELAQDAAPGRKEELLQIAQVCSRVPWQPAETFQEALQSLWFAHIINTWEDGINANSLGRLDQILYPYYEADLREGRLTKDQAFELLCCFWIKLYRDYDVQQSCVGGCDTQGNPAVNELSWMMLDATEALNFIRCLSLRYDSNTDPAFLRRALEVVGHVQKGVPFFFNDEVIIPALASKGIRLEDARQYTQIGCVETVLPGLSNPHAVSGETNLLKALEYALADGHSLFDPERIPGLATGALESFVCYEDLYNAVKAQIRHILQVCCKKVAMWTEAACIHNPKPYKSLLSDDCIQNGRDFNNHGVRYDFYQIMLGGVPNLADSLMVIRQLVYEQKKYTLPYLLQQLQDDFPDEVFRTECLRKVPKFGNDVDEVDAIAKDLILYCCDILDELEAQYGLSFHAQPFTFLWMVDHGNVTAATPDGRHKGEIIAYSMSPMQGRDCTGFTALMNSLSKMPGKRCPGSVSAIVEVDPGLFTDHNIQYFADILLVAAAKGLCNVQFNTIDAATMLDAQLHPERHNNLAVRVSGFSQKFNLLDKPLQDHIIGRTKHQWL